MGDMAYYRDIKTDRISEIEEHFVNSDSEHFEGESYEKMIWTTKEDRRILISDMTDSHLQNTRMMLERNDLIDSVQYKRIVEELEIRGFKKIDLKSVPTHDLIEELRRRVK